MAPNDDSLPAMTLCLNLDVDFDMNSYYAYTMPSENGGKI
jgi:hypothetical protein